MSKLNGKPQHVANLPKTGHNLGFVFDYTCAPGMILPINQDLLNPGETVYLDIDLSSSRTMEMQSAAYANMDIHVEHFFVPLSLIYSPFESFIYQTNDFFSSFFSSQNNIKLPLLNLLQQKTSIISDKDVSVGPNAVISGVTTPLFDSVGKSAARLFEHLGYGRIVADSTEFNPNIFPWALCAYNAIYQYYFRFDDFEIFDSGAYNLDSFVDRTTFFFNSSRCLLHYAPQNMDYFNSLKNSPIISGTNVNVGLNNLPLAKNWLSRDTTSSVGVSNFPVIGAGSVGTSGNVTVAPGFNSQSTDLVKTNFGFRSTYGSSSIDSLSLSGFPNGVDINTANLRALFANEKLWTITGQAKKTYDAQTLAHFGFNVPTDVKHQVQKIGSQVFPIRVGEVISTSGTADQPLGTVAGKGYVSGDGRRQSKFTAPCHGVVMSVAYVSVDRVNYSSFNKINSIATWQDFYQPEFDHLGMQPIFGYEISSSSSNEVADQNFGKIVGWQYRYEQFKRKWNRGTSAFVPGGRFHSWNAIREPLYGYVDTAISVPTDKKWLLYESPTALNGIMTIDYSVSTPTDILNERLYDYDSIVCHAIVNYKKVSTMSEFSLPRLDA